MFFQKIQSKIQDWPQAKITADNWRAQGHRIVFTNGCFDLLHYGHIHYLAQAKGLGGCLIIGLNSDSSVKRLKGPARPIKDENTRLHLLAAMQCVDMVVLFEEDTPYNLIKNLQPDILVKGGDWKPEQIIGNDIVLEKGGQVLSLPYIDGNSTTDLEKKIRNENENYTRPQ